MVPVGAKPFHKKSTVLQKKVLGDEMEFKLKLEKGLNLEDCKKAIYIHAMKLNRTIDRLSVADEVELLKKRPTMILSSNFA